MKTTKLALHVLFSFSFLMIVFCGEALSQAVNRPVPPTPGTMPPRRLSPVSPRSGNAPGAARPTQNVGGGQVPIIPIDDSPNALNFQDSSVHLVVMEYAMRRGLTPIFAPGISADTKITLRSIAESPLTDEQYLTAIEQILNLNGIALEIKDEKFLQVIPSADFRKHGVKTYFNDPETGEAVVQPEHGQFVSQMVELKYIDISEAQSIITGFVRQGAQIQAIERSNSIMITDSADTVNRIVEVLKYVDRPIVERETPNFIQIRYAKAADIKARIEEIVKSVQEEQTGKKTTMPQERTVGAPGAERRQLPPGVSLPGGRRRIETDTAPKGAETFEALVADAQRGVIRGKVSIIADERTNVLIILTRPENMVFFNQVIEQLDVPTAPEVVVEVHRLEHAVAKDAATLLNDLIGNKKASENDAKPSARREPNRPSEAGLGAPRNLATSVPATTADQKTRLGQLDSENIKILADERTNALIIMASYGDMLVIREIIKSMDIMLSQVVIETVILSIKFNNSLETGMSWVQRAMMTGTDKNGSGPSMVFASSGGASAQKPVSALSKTTTESMHLGNGANFVATLVDFNIDLIAQAVASDSRTRIMNAPVVTTLDNKEAIIESTERVYYSEGTTYHSYSDNTTANIKNEDIGIKLKVTPRINKKGYIVLTIEQEWQDKGGAQVIDGNELPNILTRKMGSDVAVQSGQTVVLGGLAKNSKETIKSKVPILGDIPLLGWFFRSTRVADTRDELVIFLTPRVIDTPEQIEDEARSRKASLETDGVWSSGWSSSPLADPISEEEENQLLKRGTQTVVPPRYPLTRHLTGLNEKTGKTLPVKEQKRDGSKNPYVHFSELPINPESTEAKAETEETTEATEAKGAEEAEGVEASAEKTAASPTVKATVEEGAVEQQIEAILNR